MVNEESKGKISDKDSKRQVSPLEKTKPKRIPLTDRLEEKLKNTPQMRPHHNCASFLPESKFEEILNPRLKKMIKVGKNVLFPAENIKLYS